MAFSLKAFLGLDTTNFERGMDRARTKLNSTVKSILTSLGPLVGFVGFSALSNGALSLAREITNLSKVANTSGEDFQKLAFGAKTVGIEQEKLADILKDTLDKIGDFEQTGGGPMAYFFENIAPKVGVTAEMFKELSGPDALQLYYNSIEKANLSQAEMTFYMEAVASDATQLIPLLQEGGRGFEEFGEKAEAAGLIMSDLEKNQLEAINQKMDVWKKRGIILAGTILTKVIPALSILKSGLVFIGDVLGVAASNIVAFGSALGTVVNASIQPAISAMKALGYSIQSLNLIAKRDFDGATTAAQKAKDELASIEGEMKAIPSAMKEAAIAVKTNVESGFKVLGESVERENANILNSLNDIIGVAEEAGEAVGAVGSGGDSQGGGESTSGSSAAKGKGTEIELEQKLRKLKLEAIKAEVRGEDEVAEALKRRIELAEKILKIMRETGATQQEATIIANKQAEAEGKPESPGEKRRGSGERESRMGRPPTMEERERDAGLFLRGNDTLSGRRHGPEDVSTILRQSENGQEKELKTANDYLSEVSRNMKTVATEMTRES